MNAHENPRIVVTGLGHSLPHLEGAPADPTPHLRIRKNRKFMGAQDDLAVVAAARALQMACLYGQPLGERTGLYLSVGYIPFERVHFEEFLDSARDGARFSMKRFSEVGFREVNPLLTFRCLPNMPAFHVSMNFDLQGPYFISYPGAAQLYTALDEACAALRDGVVEVALCGGVAQQRNFLVEHHFRRITPPVPKESLRDAAGFLVLESEAHAAQRGATVRAHLRELALSYTPHPPGTPRAQEESFDAGEREHQTMSDELGPASLPARLSLTQAGLPVLGAATSRRFDLPSGSDLSALPIDRALPVRVRHVLQSRDGFSARSTWELT